LHCDRSGDRALVVDRQRLVFVLRLNERPGVPVRVRGRRSNSPRPPDVLEGHANVSYAAFSPDGRYVATGTWRGTGVRVWDADTGRQVATLPARESAGVGFTPDGSRLLVLESEGAYRIHRVPGWELTTERCD